MRPHSASVGCAFSAALLYGLLGNLRIASAATEPEAEPSGESSARVESSKSSASGVRIENGVRIESSTCPHPLVEDVQHLARVELSSAGLPEGEDAPRVILSCAGQVVLIRALLGAAADARQLDLEQTDDTLRARVIALAIAELVRDTAARAAQPPTPARAASPAPRLTPQQPPNAGPPPPLAASSANRLLVFGKLSNFGSSFQPLYGGGLTFSHDFERLALGFGPSLMASKNAAELGSVHVLAADLSLRLSLRFPSRTLPSEIGVGHALGLVRLKGSSDLPDTSAGQVSGIWAAPFVFGAIEAQLGAPFFLQVAGQFGIVSVPIHGLVARGPDVGMAGAWAGLSLGLGLNL